MFAPKFSHKPILTIAMAIALGGFCSTAFAQGVFEGSGEEDNSGCVGDGCGMEFNEVSNSTDDTQSDNANGVETVDENGVKTVVYGTDSTAQDSVAQDSTKAADSTKVTEFFDDEDTRANYVQENASEYRARKEGFSKSIQFGFRAGAGANMNFLGNHTDGWNVGFDLEAGAIAKLPIGNDFSVAAGLDFSYRTYATKATTTTATTKQAFLKCCSRFPPLSSTPSMKTDSSWAWAQTSVSRCQAKPNSSRPSTPRINITRISAATLCPPSAWNWAAS